MYKFLPAHFARDAIKDRRLKISTFRDMNDPFELLGIRFEADTSVPDYIWRLFNDKFIPILQRRTGLLCFSLHWHNPVLWAHYAANHTGIALGISIEKPTTFDAWPVKYVSSMATRDISVLLKELTRTGPEGWPFTSRAFQELTTLYMEVLCTKSKSWSYEEETRIFINLKKREHGHYFLDFEDKIRLTEVILGMKCALKPGDILRELKTYGNAVKVMRATPSWHNFELYEDQDKTVTYMPAKDGAAM